MGGFLHVVECEGSVVFMCVFMANFFVRMMWGTHVEFISDDCVFVVCVLWGMHVTFCREY